MDVIKLDSEKKIGKDELPAILLSLCESFEDRENWQVRLEDVKILAFELRKLAALFVVNDQGEIVVDLSILDIDKLNLHEVEKYINILINDIKDILKRYLTEGFISKAAAESIAIILDQAAIEISNSVLARRDELLSVPVEEV